jgi:hypothetical protein
MTDVQGGYAARPGGQEPPSTPQVARQEAADVGRTVADSGGQVAQTAGQQVRRVAAETSEQARDLLNEGRQQVTEQARQGQQKAASSLHTIADQLEEMRANSDDSGLAPEMVRQAAGHARRAASWLEDRQPGDLLNEVRAFARRKPGVFLAGAALAGVLVGRLTRGAVDAQSDDSDQRRRPEQPPFQAVNPAGSPPAAPVPGVPGAAQPGYPAPAYSQPGGQVPPGYAPPPWQGGPGQVRP